MDPEKPVQCYRDGEGKRWRVQCDEKTRFCLYAPDSELDAEGSFIRPLERARHCPAYFDEVFDKASFQAKGYTLVRGLPDAPYGWVRDDRGRVFQVNFDLKRRLYFGGGYAPLFQDAGNETGRSHLDFGLLVLETGGTRGSRTRHRFRAIEGEVHLAPFAANVVLAHYDISHNFLKPLLRITTFVGKPRRHDAKMNIGLWAEAGHLEVHHTPTGDESLIRFATTHLTVDLWQSPDLYSFVRLRGGLGLEKTYAEANNDRAAWTPGAAIEADLTLDRDGFHHIGAEIAYEAPQFTATDPVVGDRAERLRARLQYEVIAIAINDQPLSLRLQAGAEKRSDVPGVPDEWAFTATAGLRFSLWAPARPH